jgi:tripartite-type tricarboxylate transporter receptor subunit TctC
MRLKTFELLLLILIMVFGVSAVQATYPDKPIKVIIGFSAGGPLDAHMRLLVEKLNLPWDSQSLLISNQGRVGSLVPSLLPNHSLMGIRFC